MEIVDADSQHSAMHPGLVQSFRVKLTNVGDTPLEGYFELGDVQKLKVTVTRSGETPQLVEFYARNQANPPAIRTLQPGAYVTNTIFLPLDWSSSPARLEVSAEYFDEAFGRSCLARSVEWEISEVFDEDLLALQYMQDNGLLDALSIRGRPVSVRDRMPTIEKLLGQENFKKTVYYPHLVASYAVELLKPQIDSEGVVVDNEESRQNANKAIHLLEELQGVEGYRELPAALGMLAYHRGLRGDSAGEIEIIKRIIDEFPTTMEARESIKRLAHIQNAR